MPSLRSDSQVVRKKNPRLLESERPLPCSQEALSFRQFDRKDEGEEDSQRLITYCNYSLVILQTTYVTRRFF